MYAKFFKSRGFKDLEYYIGCLHDKDKDMMDMDIVDMVMVDTDMVDTVDIFKG